MSTLQPALSSVLFLLQCRAAASSTLEDTCKKYAADGGQASHDYDYCVKTLGANPASATADAVGLTALAINIALSTARATASRMARLQVTETMPARLDCLDKCAERIATAERYDSTVRELWQAARDNFIRDDGEWWVTQTMLAEAQHTAQYCDTAFVEAEERSLLSAADRQLDEEVKLALGILPDEPPATN